jgi:4-methyl-5(b-hydroxyethyl)-thiazole monophosphate biosynthesis
MAKRALCLLVDGFEEIETIVPVDLLRRAGAQVVMASVSGAKLVTGRCQISVQSDALLSDIEGETFDLLLIPGGPGVRALRADGRPARLARRHVEAGRIVAAICAAPTVLADAGLLAGRRFTAHDSVVDELPQSLVAERVVEDGQIITSRGAGTAVDFALTLVRRLFGADAADRIARSIMA